MELYELDLLYDYTRESWYLDALDAYKESKEE